MREIGQVISIDNNLAKISIVRNSICGDCGACQIGQENMTMETMARNPLFAKVGEKVEIETETTNILKASFIIYTFPMILFILGSLIGYGIGSYLFDSPINNYIAFGVGIVFTIISYAIIKVNENKFVKDKAFQPEILRIID